METVVEQLASALNVVYPIEDCSEVVIGWLADRLANALRKEHKWPLKGEIREMPYSEVCMHLKVAGKLMMVAPAAPLDQNPYAYQLYTLTGEKFSFPIAKSEAGLYQSTLAVCA